MAETLSQFIGEIRKRRDQEMVQKLQAITPMLEYDVQRGREQQEYDKKLGMIREDFTNQLDNEYREGFTSAAADINTFEGLSATFGQYKGKQEYGRYSGLTKSIYGEAWKDNPDAVARLERSIAGSQSREELDAMLKPVEQDYNRSRRISQSSTLFKNMGYDADTFTKMTEGITDPDVLNQTTTAFVEQQTAQKYATGMRDRLVAMGATAEQLEAFDSNTLGARTTAEVNMAAENSGIVMKDSQQLVSYEAIARNLGMSEEKVAEMMTELRSVKDGQARDKIFNIYAERGNLSSIIDIHAAQLKKDGMDEEYITAFREAAGMAKNQAELQLILSGELGDVELDQVRTDYVNFLKIIDPKAAENFEASAVDIKNATVLTQAFKYYADAAGKEKPKTPAEIDILAKENLTSKSYKFYEEQITKGVDPMLSLQDAMAKQAKENADYTFYRNQAVKPAKDEKAPTAYTDAVKNIMIKTTGNSGRVYFTSGGSKNREVWYMDVTSDESGYLYHTDTGKPISYSDLGSFKNTNQFSADERASAKKSVNFVVTQPGAPAPTTKQPDPKKPTDPLDIPGVKVRKK